MMVMRRRLFILIFALAALLYFLYRVAHQYAFETYLDTLNITFDDFPPEYAKVLNDSVARGQQPEDFDYAATFTETQIPRLIHYIWFKDLYATREGATQIPSVGSRSPELCRQFNPGYEIRMWNATSAREFLAAEYAWFLPTYDGYRYPIQRIDALKYFVLWHFGGVYMDLDIACRRSLDPLLGFPAWFPEASPLGVNNDLMASRKGHSILREMTEGLITHNRNYLSPYLTIFWTTGPSFTSQMLQEWYEKCGRGGCSGRSGNKTAETDTFVVLPRIFYSEEYTFFGHSPGGTWHGGDVAVVLWLVERPWALLGIFASFVGLSIFLVRRRRTLRGRRDERKRDLESV